MDSLVVADLLSHSRVTLDLPIFTMIGGFIVPLVVALITKHFAQKWVKTITNVVLSGVTAALAVFTVKGSMAGADVQEMLYAFGITVVTANATHQGVWKPLGVSEVIANWWPDKGLGTVAPEHGENPELIDGDDER